MESQTKCETASLHRIERATRRVAKPPPKLTISQWAAENLVLSAEDSAEPGKYQPSRAPYQAGIMDAVSDPLIEELVVMSSAQVGKTLIIKAIIGYFVDQDPSPILVVQPTLEMAETFSKDRLAPMVRDTPCLRGKIADAKARDSGNTILHKRFPGGHLTIVGANAAASLASRPIRVALFDEVDRYPASAGTEGDPVALGEARTKTFWNRRRIKVSTPGDEKTSRINPAWERSDKRRFYVPCHACGHRQHLVWQNVSWTDENPATAVYACEQCGVAWSDAQRVDSLRFGFWLAEQPHRRVAGFHLNELYSPFRKLSEIVADFLGAKRSPETLKTWVNTSLGEPWQDREGEKVDAHQIAARKEPYTLAPEGVLLVTMAVDTQDDRLEIEFVGWGEGEESWGLDHVVLRGNPGEPILWQLLSDQLGRTFQRQDGATLTVTACAIDSAGHHTKAVYEWARKHPTHVFPMVGRAGQGKPLIKAGEKMKSARIRLYTVGVDTAKELLLLSRLRITEPGPGYCHFPATYSDAWFDQLTNERAITKYRMGQPYRAWVLTKGKRNEALDLRVYGMALVALLRPVWTALAARLKPGSEIGQAQPPRRRVIHSSYMSR